MAELTCIHESVLELVSTPFWIYYVNLLESEFGVPPFLTSILAKFVVATMFMYLSYVILNIVVSFHEG